MLKLPFQLTFNLQNVKNVNHLWILHEVKKVGVCRETAVMNVKCAMFGIFRSFPGKYDACERIEKGFSNLCAKLAQASINVQINVL